MKVDKAEILKALTPLTVGIKSSPILTEGECFRFYGDCVSVFDGTLGYVRKLDGELESLKEFDGFVNFNLFLKILRQIKSKNVFLEWRENELLIKGKRRKGAVVIEHYDSHSPIHNNDALKSQSLPLNFQEAIQACLMIDTDGDLDGGVKAVHLTSDFIERTNRFQIIQYRFEDNENNKNNEDDKFELPELFLSPEVLSTLAKHDIDKIGFTKTHIVFSTEDYDVYVNRVNLEDGQFPDLSDLFFDEGKTIVFDEDTLGSLKLSKAFVDPTMSSPKVDFGIQSHFQIMKLENEKGWFEVKTKKESEDSLDVCLNPEFLKPILKYTNVGVLGHKPAISFTKDNLTYMFALMGNE